MQVEIHKWTGTALIRCAMHKDCTRHVTSLSIIKHQYVLAGNLQRGMAFLHARDKVWSLITIHPENYWIVISEDFLAEISVKSP